MDISEGWTRLRTGLSSAVYSEVDKTNAVKLNLITVGAALETQAVRIQF